MKEGNAILISLLLVLMTAAPVVADSLHPNAQSATNDDVLSIDAYVTTKFTSVGDSIELFALTQGHSGTPESTNTVVTAQVLHYPENDPIGIITQGELPSNPVVVDNVVLTPSGVHENDSTIMVWAGDYTVPLDALGGVYGASITVEESGLQATDNPTQLPEKIVSEIEGVLKTVDTTWDTANPTMDMKAVFDNLNASGDGLAGGWAEFVEDATAQPGLGDSAQLWNNMISAGYNNPSYEMEDGAQFLEALMEFLESDDLDAGMAFLTGLFVYGNEFPLPRTVNDFGPMMEYVGTFDPIENFTRFSGTENFSAAYDAMLGSDEWDALSDALDNLSNNEMVFQSFQTVLRNMALLSVSAHPDALIAGFEAWVEPLAGGDYENMTPFQKLVVSWSEMDVTVSDLDGDDFPDEVIWEYELLLNTSEGLQWQAKMDASYPHVSDGFDDFNGFDVELLTILRDTVEDPAWEQVGDAVNEFTSWAANFTVDRELEWEYNHDQNDDEGDGDSEDEGSEQDSFQYVVFDDLHPIQTTLLNKHVLDLGFELSINGPWNSHSDYPNDFNMTVTDSSGQETNVVLSQESDGSDHYLGRFTASSLGIETYTFSQPLENYRPACADDGCTIENSRLDIRSLRPAPAGDVAVEVNDELFIVSAIGVLVNQSETTVVGQPYVVESTTYDAAMGALDAAELDSAILRISPGLGESAVSTLSPEGSLEISSGTPSNLEAVYSGSDVDGQLSVTIEPRQEDKEGDDMVDDMGSFQGEVTVEGTANGWDASSALANQISLSSRGVALITTSGTTPDGLEFRFRNEMPLPSSPGCTISSGSGSSTDVYLGFSVQDYYYQDDDTGRVSFDRTNLVSLSIDWGDGATTSVTTGHSDDDGRENYGEQHAYAASAPGGSSTYTIEINYEFENAINYVHRFVFKENHGFEQYDDDGNPYHQDFISTNEEWRYCELNSPDQDATPSAPIINEFVTNGPFEVMTQTIGASDEDGKSNLSVVPPHTGAYVSVVQAKHVRSSDGATLTGVGLNFGIATSGAVDVSGMDVLGYFSGLPVYAANGTDSTRSIQIQTHGINDRHQTSVGSLPLDLSVPFPDMDEAWNTEGSVEEIQFNPGETSRTVQLNITAPLSLIGVVSVRADANWETSTSDSLTPLAVHFGLVLNNPEHLDLTGPLGPGQTTNVALDGSLDPATRMLAVASPSHGFDPSTIDFSTITEAFSTELLRPATDWPGTEHEVSKVCEELELDIRNGYDADEEHTFLHFRITHESDSGRYDRTPHTINTNTARLIETSNGRVVPQHSTTTSTDEMGPGNTVYVVYNASGVGEEGEYEFSTGSHGLNSSMVLESHGHGSLEVRDERERCEGDDRFDDASVVADLFDEYFTRFSTIAWGQGTSADLNLPHLSSPLSDYTVIGVAQQGSGNEAQMVAAFNFISSQVNPEPPEMENLSLVFTPSEPAPGDVVLLTITDESNNPVEGLSIILTQNNTTMASLISSETGQASFQIPLGETKISVSGGQYNPFEMVIVVSEDQSEDDTSLPGDADGDGYGDSLDAFPNDENEWLDTDGDGVGNNADDDDDGDGLTDIEEYLYSPNTDPLDADSDGDGYCDGAVDVEPHCLSGDAFPTDSSAWNDTDGDGLPDDVVGVSSLNLPEDQDDDNDGWSDEEEADCGTDSLDATSTPSDANNNGVCDVLDGDDSIPADEQPQAQDDDSTGDDTPSGDSSQSTTSMIVAGAGIGLLILVALSVLVFLRSRGRTSGMDDAEFAKEEMMFEEFAREASSPPSRPPHNAVGEMYDGYEAIEFPKDSGRWFYRDPQTGQWMEWT